MHTDESWLSGQMWTELKGIPGRPGIPSWDIPITPKRRKSATVAVKCGRCDGKGAIASFSVRNSGVCFACGGSRFRLISKEGLSKQKSSSGVAGGREMLKC